MKSGGTRRCCCYATDTTCSGRATSSAHRCAYCIANRVGASSPVTKVTNVNTSVIATTATGRAAAPRNDRYGTSGSALTTGEHRVTHQQQAHDRRLPPVTAHDRRAGWTYRGRRPP